jgi:RimJ/RimL family protein N-acetyltransferase
VISLETPRLVLRPMSGSDAIPFLEIHEDPEVSRFVMLGSPPGGAAAAWRNIAMMVGHWSLRGYGPWTVVDRHTGEVIGRAGFWNPEGWPGLEIGWVLRRTHWGRGLATEAARAALDWLWSRTDVDHVISIIQPDNHRSIRVAVKIGESFERESELNGVAVHVYGMRRPGL